MFIIGGNLLQSPSFAEEGEEEVEGWLSIVWGDGYPGTNRQAEIYTLTNEQDETFLLHFDEEFRESLGSLLQLNRKYVRALGKLRSAKNLHSTTPVMDVSSLTTVISPKREGQPLEADISPAVSGSKPWVTIMCKFSDHSTTEPKNLAYFTNMYSNAKPGFDHYWREQSYGTVNVAGSEAYGWYQLDEPESHYNPTDSLGGTDLDLLAEDCIKKADPDVDYTNFSGINMMFNTNFDNGYAWGGGRYMSIDDASNRFWSVTWEPPWGYRDICVIAHEMGHGFGLPHSSGTYGKTYDNQWDVMSDTWSNCSNSRDGTYGCLGQHTIAYHKDILGWIPANRKYTYNGGNVTIQLDHLALATTSNYRMIQIPIAGSTSRYYTIEVRQKNGYDVKLPGKAVIIHEVNRYRSRPANVIDEDNDGNTGDSGAMWTVGETFSDSSAGFKLQVISENANGFRVHLSTNSFPSSAVMPILINKD